MPSASHSPAAATRPPARGRIHPQRVRRACASVSTLLLAASAALAFGAGVAQAAPRPAEVVEDGRMFSLFWTSCKPTPVRLRTSAPADATPVPAVGGSIYQSDHRVVGFRREGPYAIWEFLPSKAACDAGKLFDQRLTSDVRMRWTARRYVLRAGETSGVTSLAGLPVRDAQRPPTVKAARRALGAPTRTRSIGATTCRARWDALGLRAVFAVPADAKGAGNACSRGLLQSAEITNPKLWAIVISPDLTQGLSPADIAELTHPGIVESTQASFLVNRGRATERPGGWALASVSEPGNPLRSTILAHGRSTGVFTSYDVWVGAAKR